MKLSVVLCVVGLLAFASGQSCSWGSNQVNSIPVDDAPGGRAQLGAMWRVEDFPENATTQDFSVLFNRPNWWMRRYIYIPNTVPDGLNMYNQHWLPQNLSDKLAADPYVRPEGFKYSLITPYNAKYPCVELEAVAGFGVEIMVYALVDVEICIRHKYEAGSLNAQSAQLFNDVCAQQRLQHCFIAPDYYGTANRPSSGNFVYEIYVRTSNPPDYTVPVFYRSRKSEFRYVDQGSQFSSGNTEMWCMMISGSVDTTYPEFASVVPPNIQIPATGAAFGFSAVGTLMKVLGVSLFVVLVGW